MDNSELSAPNFYREEPGPMGVFMSAEEIVRQERIHQELRDQQERERQIQLLQEQTDAIRQELARPDHKFTLERVVQLCFESSKARGWWYNLNTMEYLHDRNKAEMICLMHSEVSEAYEAAALETNDDKLPHRPGVEVELADALIRIFDFAVGFESPTFFKELTYDCPYCVHGGGEATIEQSFSFVESNCLDFSDIHLHLSLAMEAVRKGKDWAVHLAEATVACIQYCNWHNLDLAGAVLEKMRYNMSRKDHDIAERLKSGGQKF